MLPLGLFEGQLGLVTQKNKKENTLERLWPVCYDVGMGNQRAGRLALHCGGANPPDRREGGMSMITYQDFFLFCTFVVSLISLLYQIFKGKK